MKKIILPILLLIGLSSFNQDKLNMKIKFKNTQKFETEVVLIKIGSDTVKHFFVDNKIVLELSSSHDYKIVFYNSTSMSTMNIQGLGSSNGVPVVYSQRLVVDWGKRDKCKYIPKY